jgi:prefoldin subunit 5|tara:strand:+ start:3188 stop:3394 length:207 start_codon:yes stop_codon:yes gene_type:complete
MSKIEDIAEELRHLQGALNHLERAIDEYESIDWPTGVYPPHHVEMEMEEARSQIDERIQEIEDKLERI